MNPYAGVINRLYWQCDQFAIYAVIFVYDDYLRTRAVDRMDITQVATRHVITDIPGLMRLLPKLGMIADTNDEALEDMRAAIIAMPDDQWAEIAEGL